MSGDELTVTQVIARAEKGESIPPECSEAIEKLMKPFSTCYELLESVKGKFKRLLVITDRQGSVIKIINICCLEWRLKKTSLPMPPQSKLKLQTIANWLRLRKLGIIGLHEPPLIDRHPQIQTTCAPNA
jgi:hypothetical protein